MTRRESGWIEQDVGRVRLKGITTDIDREEKQMALLIGLCLPSFLDCSHDRTRGALRLLRYFINRLIHLYRLGVGTTLIHLIYRLFYRLHPRLIVA